MATVLSRCTLPVVAAGDRLKMTQVLLYVIATITCVTGHPPASTGTQRTCFNSFDNFDECWEKIEELCLNEATGEFQDCFNEDPGYDHKDEEEDNYTELFPHSQHCYARFYLYSYYDFNTGFPNL